MRLRLAASSLKITSFLRFHSRQQQRATKGCEMLTRDVWWTDQVSKDPATVVVSVGMLIPSLDQKSSAERHPATVWLAVSFSCRDLRDLTGRTIHDHLSMEIDPALHPFMCQQPKKELNPGRGVASILCLQTFLAGRHKGPRRRAGPL